MKGTVQYFPVVPFIMPNTMVLSFKCLGEMLNCNLLNESYPVESSGDAV